MALSSPSVLAFASAAIGLFMAAFALRLAKAPRWSPMVWYAGAAASAAGFSLGSAPMSMGVSAVVTCWAIRVAMAFAGLHVVCWCVFFARWERRRLTRVERALVLAALASVVVSLVPQAIVTDEADLRHTRWLGLTYLDPVPSIMSGPVYLVQLASIVWFARTGLRIARREGGLLGIPLGFAVVFVCALHDMASALRLIDTPYLMDFGFFSLVAGVGASITAQFVENARTLEAYSVKLERTQQELVERERLAALGELSAVVAHEVRNPLAVIFNALAALRRAGRTPPQGEVLLGMVEEEAERLKRLVAALLDFARPYALDREPHDLVGLVTEAVALSRGALGDDAPPVEITSDGSTTVECDRLLLSQAVSNLVTNALQSEGRRGPVRVTVRGEADGVCLAVADDGRGVSPDATPRIFQPFFTTRPTGTGLGLALVKRIVEAHAGTVHHEPTPGGGATFVLRLPRTTEGLTPRGLHRLRLR